MFAAFIKVRRIGDVLIQAFKKLLEKNLDVNVKVK